MAELAFTAVDRAFLSLATMQLPPRERTEHDEWDRALKNYLRLRTLEGADREFGYHSVARETFDRTQLLVEQKFGKGYKNHPEGREIIEKAWQAYNDAEAAHTRDFEDALWEAERKLVLTPAPDIAAAMFKVEMIKYCGTDGMSEDPTAVFQIVAGDIARFTAGEA